MGDADFVQVVHAVNDLNEAHSASGEFQPFAAVDNMMAKEGCADKKS